MEVRQSSLVVEKSGPCFIIGDAEAAPGAGRFSDRATADAAASAATASAFAARVREPIPADPDNGGRLLNASRTL